MADKLKMQTENIADKNYEILSKMFPNALTETITGYDDDGKPIVERAIDADVLRQEISCKVVEGKDERYQFTWPDKKKAVLLANTPIDKTLRPCREESVDFDNTENLYIEGDNLDVLKLLHETYLGKVKMIYIDPPYNTGSDSFIYNDNYYDSKISFNKKNGAFDEDGNIMYNLKINNNTNGRFHTDWLNMMYSRLKLAKDMLTDDGVICIQIDDNEFENLKKICDEIFGTDSFMTMIVVKMSEPTGMKMAHANVRLPKLKEYILTYKKSKDTYINSVKIPKEKWDSEYKTYLKGITNKEVEFIKYVRDNESRSNNDIQQVDEILSKVSYCSISDVYKENSLVSDEEKFEFNYENAWRIVQTVSMTGGAKELADKKRTELSQTFYSIQTPQKKMYFIKGDYSTDIEKPRCKILFADDYLTVNPCDFWQDIKTTGLDNEGYVDFKNGKKPIKLLMRLIQLFSNKGDLVLDFFSGSGSIGHAVMQYCKNNNTNRRFILVQLQENLDEQYEKADLSAKKDIKKMIEFLDNIKKPHLLCEIGKQRLRLAGNDICYGDVGFRVLKLDSSNMKDVYYTPSKTQQSLFDTYADNIKEDRTPEDLLFQVMLDLGVLLSSKIEKTTIAGKQVFNVADGFLIACFDNDVTEETVKAVAEKKPYYAVFRDSSMANDSVATNFDQIFESISPDTVRKVL